jgi:signal transduction histidine kinase
LKALLGAYQQMASSEFEAVDVNAVVRKVRTQLDTEARDNAVTIYLREQPDTPPAQAVQSRLEQILLNLVLNAIQQIALQRRHMDRIAREQGQDTALLQRGQVIVRTRVLDAQTRYPIRIEVLDTGPGIHHRQQRDLFKMDTSTRRTGHGLGLFISQNLAETMGGRVRLADTLAFMGSVFVIELPLAVENGE